jgi:hypothetical protein
MNVSLCSGILLIRLFSYFEDDPVCISDHLLCRRISVLYPPRPTVSRFECDTTSHLMLVVAVELKCSSAHRRNFWFNKGSGLQLWFRTEPWIHAVLQYGQL